MCTIYSVCHVFVVRDGLPWRFSLFIWLWLIVTCGWEHHCQICITNCMLKDGFHTRIQYMYSHTYAWAPNCITQVCFSCTMLRLGQCLHQLWFLPFKIENVASVVGDTMQKIWLHTQKLTLFWWEKSSLKKSWLLWPSPHTFSHHQFAIGHPYCKKLGRRTNIYIF